MKLRLFLLTLILLNSGCTLFQYGGTTQKTQQVPLKPIHQQPEMAMSKQQAIDIVVQLGYEAVDVGIEEASTQANTLLDTALVLQSVEGVPVDRIAHDDSEKVQELLVTIKTMEMDYRRAVSNWEETLRELTENKEKMIELHRENGKIWGWFITACIIMGILIFLFPSIGVPLARMFISKARTAAERIGKEAVDMTKEQFKQVVTAIEDTKENLKDKNPEVYTELLDNLKKRTDTRTRDTINELRNRI